MTTDNTDSAGLKAPSPTSREVDQWLRECGRVGRMRLIAHISSKAAAWGYAQAQEASKAGQASQYTINASHDEGGPVDPAFYHMFPQSAQPPATEQAGVVVSREDLDTVLMTMAGYFAAGVGAHPDCMAAIKQLKAALNGKGAV